MQNLPPKLATILNVGPAFIKHAPKVSVVVLNWNTYELTKECLESLQEVTYSNYEVILVDNASRDGSAQKLGQEFPEATLIQNNANLGFARGCNAGIRCALNHGADFVLLLNSDSTVEKGFLEPAVEVAESDSKIGLVSGKIYLKDKPGYLWYAGGSFSLLRGMVVIRGWHQLDEGHFNKAEEVDISTGALMLIKREVIDKVGLLPEEYFFGQEEWDYSLTVRRAGYRLYYVPEFVTYHRGDGSHRNLDAKYMYCGYRNRLIFQEKFLPRPLFHAWKAVYVLYHQFLAERRLLGLGKETFQEASYALKAALRDHNRAVPRMVREEDLIAFERELKETLAGR